jgi:hypothetical protein
MSAQTSIAEPEVGSPVAAAAQAQEDSSIAAATATTIVQAIVEAGEFASLPPPNVVVRDEGESSSELEDDYDQLHVSELLCLRPHLQACNFMSDIVSLHIQLGLDFGCYRDWRRYTRRGDTIQLGTNHCR